MLVILCLQLVVWSEDVPHEDACDNDGDLDNVRVDSARRLQTVPVQTTTTNKFSVAIELEHGIEGTPKVKTTITSEQTIANANVEPKTVKPVGDKEDEGETTTTDRNKSRNMSNNMNRADIDKIQNKEEPHLYGCHSVQGFQTKEEECIRRKDFCQWSPDDGGRCKNKENASACKKVSWASGHVWATPYIKCAFWDRLRGIYIFCNDADLDGNILEFVEKEGNPNHHVQYSEDLVKRGFGDRVDHECRPTFLLYDVESKKFLNLDGYKDTKWIGTEKDPLHPNYQG